MAVGIPLWSSLAPLPVTVGGPVSATDNDGRVYVIGSPVGSETQAWRYNPATGVWDALANLPVARVAAAAAADSQGRIYVMGGTVPGSGTYQATVHRFDPATGAWASVASMGFERGWHAAVTGTDGRVYVFGGQGRQVGSGGFSSLLVAVERFDPATGAWQALAPMLVALRDVASAVGKFGHVYLFGGRTSDDTIVRSTYQYDPTYDHWLRVADLPDMRHLAAATAIDGRPYVLGGYSGRPQFPTTSTVWRYEESTDTWTNLDPMPAGRYQHTVTAGPLGLYVLGGFDPNRNATATAWAGAVNRAPYPPTLVVPAEGATLARTIDQQFSWKHEDFDDGDSQSAYRVRHRVVGATAWTSTGWVMSTGSRHTFPAGTFVEGDWEWQAATKDAQGLESSFSASRFFTAATPPPGPSITDPANGATVPASTYGVVWSVPDQDAYQLQVLDGATVVSDTGQVNSTAARSRTVEFPDNDTTRTIQLRVLFEGLWSPWSSVTVTVSYTPPAVPSIVLQSDDRAGSITVTPGIPTPATGEPQVVAFDTWVRRVGEAGDGTRVAKDTPPSLDYTWWAPASGTDYEFRILVRGDNDTTTWSPWAGGPARYDESTYDAAAYA